MNYYYLVASLPMLKFGIAAPISEEDFLFQCTGVLNERDLEELRNVFDFNAEDCTRPFAKKYLEFEKSLRYGISAVRAGRLGLDVKAYTDHEGGYNTFVSRTVVDAFAKTNPRERARVVDHARWYMLNELSQFEPFGFSAVLAYALKVKLLRRWGNIVPEKGRKNFNGYIENILSTVQLEAS